MSPPSRSAQAPKVDVLTNGRDRRKLPPPSRKPRLPQGGWLVGCIVLAVAIVATILDLTLSGPSGHRAATPAPTPTSTPSATARPLTAEQKAAQAWQHTAEGDEEPAAQAYIAMVQDAENWQKPSSQKDKISAAGLRLDIQSVERSYAEAASALNHQSAFPQDPQALRDFRASVTLYAEAAHLTADASRVAAGPLRQQTLLSVTRVRHLGDLVYDQANDSLKPYLPPAVATPNLHFDPPAEVPIWATIPASSTCASVTANCASLAPGRPLESKPQLLIASPTPQPTPATQPVGGWTAAVSAETIPTAAAEARAITGQSADAARTMSDRLAAAQANLVSIHGPSDDVTANTTLQLDLLIHAEAARTAQEADLATSRLASAELRADAERLASVGDALWNPILGARSTHLT